MHRLAVALLWFAAARADAHPAPNSTLRLQLGAQAVHAEYWLPVSELAYARAADAGGGFEAYLLRHLAAQTPQGAGWRVSIDAIRQDHYLDHDFMVASITLTPPAGVSTREFVLVDDAVTHEVRNHVVFVVARRGDQADMLGALQYPARQLKIVMPGN